MRLIEPQKWLRKRLEVELSVQFSIFQLAIPTNCYSVLFLSTSYHNSCLFISGVLLNFWSEVFTIFNRKMHTFDLLIVKGGTLRLLIVKCVSYD